MPKYNITITAFCRHPYYINYLNSFDVLSVLILVQTGFDNRLISVDATALSLYVCRRVSARAPPENPQSSLTLVILNEIPTTKVIDKGELKK
jgi:hypothetical protein